MGAEVKPHFGCTTKLGQQHVRNYVSGLVSMHTGIIALIQFEFPLAKPEGYTAFGASCKTKHSDPVVVLVDERKFLMLAALGETALGDYSSMPFLGDGKPPSNGSNCVADANVFGARGYAGALLQHVDTGTEFCVVAGTFPHCYGAWTQEFRQATHQHCHGRRLLLIVDTNAACETEGPEASRRVSMEDIGKNQSMHWGSCSDPAVHSDEPTCCHDLRQGHPEARYWYDRTALCGGGVVEQFHVNGEFSCGADEEHKFTTAVVHLSGKVDDPAERAMDSLGQGVESPASNQLMNF